MANTKIYIHEFVDIILQNRAAYIMHMTEGWEPIGRERNMKCFGVWATVGSSERWPETTNMWELDGIHALARNFEIEFNNPKHQDPTLEVWWSGAQQYRSGGYDRLVRPAPYSPTIEESVAAGTKGGVYYHEMIRTAPGQAKTYLNMMEQDWIPTANRLGMTLCFAGRSMMVNDSEVICIWAIDDWPSWAAVEKAYESDPAVAQWRLQTQNIALDWRNKLLADGPLNPMRTGVLLPRPL